MRVLYKLQDTPRKTLRDFNVVRLGDGEVESHLVGVGKMNRMCLLQRQTSFTTFDIVNS